MLHRVRGGYAFTTPLMREAAYSGIGKADLADRHAYLATWAAPETIDRLGYDGAGRLSLTANERDENKKRNNLRADLNLSDKLACELA